MQLDDVNEHSSAAGSGLSATLPGDGSESAVRPIPPYSLLPASILSLSEAQAGAHVQPNGLSLPEGISFESWRELGCRVTLVVNCSAWWLGDWLVYGEHAYGDRYKQAIADTSLGYKTLRNYAWVSRRFPLSRRRDTLSFGHHAEVAALPDDEQDRWLARAQQLNWSCSRLRRGLEAAKLASRQTSGAEQQRGTSTLKIHVPTERYDRWQTAAAQNNCSVQQWIILTLDHAADAELATTLPEKLLAPPSGN